MQCFKEETFAPNQPIIRERISPDYVYLIVEGQVKIVSNNNPYTKKLNKMKKMFENSD